MIDEREMDVVWDAGGSAVSAGIIDRLIADVFVKNGGAYPVNTFTLVSHPTQANAFRALLGSVDAEYRENSYVLETNPETRVKAWLEVADLPENVILLETPKARGMIKTLLFNGRIW